jgi:hypothetical protein
MFRKIPGIILSLLFISAMPANAQLMMEPSKVTLNTEAGATIIDKIYLHNTGEEVETVKIYWEDFMYVEPFNGKKKFYPAGTTEYSLKDWVNFSPQTLTLAPKTKQEVNYVIKVPQDISGGRYGVLFFERGAEKGSEGVGVSIVTRVGALFFVDIGEKNKSSEISGWKFTETTLSGVIKNNGNVFIFPQGIYYVMDEEGLVANRGEIEKIYLPPNSSAEFKADLAKDLSAGSYTAVMTFDLHDGDSLVREVDFVTSENGQTEIKTIRD